MDDAFLKFQKEFDELTEGVGLLGHDIIHMELADPLDVRPQDYTGMERPADIANAAAEHLTPMEIGRQIAYIDAAIDVLHCGMMVVELQLAYAGAIYDRPLELQAVIDTVAQDKEASVRLFENVSLTRTSLYNEGTIGREQVDALSRSIAHMESAMERIFAGEISEEFERMAEGKLLDRLAETRIEYGTTVLKLLEVPLLKIEEDLYKGAVLRKALDDAIIPQTPYAEDKKNEFFRKVKVGYLTVEAALTGVEAFQAAVLSMGTYNVKTKEFEAKTYVPARLSLIPQITA